MKLLNEDKASKLGFSADKRKRRRQHRLAAKKLLSGGGLLNGFSAPGSMFFGVAQWHLSQARSL